MYDLNDNKLGKRLSFWFLVTGVDHYWIESDHLAHYNYSTIRSIKDNLLIW